MTRSLTISYDDSVLLEASLTREEFEREAKLLLAGKLFELGHRSSRSPADAHELAASRDHGSAAGIREGARRHGRGSGRGLLTGLSAARAMPSLRAWPTPPDHR